MKKMYAFIAAVVVLAAASVAVIVNVAASDSLFVANVEALADVEEDGGNVCYDDIKTSEGLQVRYCPLCDFVPGDKNWWARKKSCN